MEKRTCRAKTREGRRCRKGALPGSPFCSAHADAERRPGILDGILPQEELEQLKQLMADPQVDDAVLVLAHALRQAVAEGAEAKEVIRACDSYVKALVARHRISGQAAQSLEQALGAALDAVGAELGIEL